jgi:membrane-bound lytic murein transglycosylase A
MTMGKVTLKPAAFADLSGWQDDDHLAAFKTFLKSCDQMLEARRATSKGSKASLAALVTACRTAKALKNPTRATARAFFEAQFVPHHVVHKAGKGILTGYYEPVLKGARKPHGRFKTPIYRRPPDLVNVVPETKRGATGRRFTHMRKTTAGLVPYLTRDQIERGALAGQGLELLYLADPVDAFFMHIQGSGRIDLTNGKSIRISYDGKNGHPYSSIGKYLVRTRQFPADKVSLQSLRKWLRADRARGQKVMWKNASFIFFRELRGPEAEGALGAMSVTLTSGRSLAVDTAYHTLGTPIFVSAPRLKQASKKGGFSRLMIAQDVGSAIKGPERGDIYYGSGDKAGRLAGTTNHPGNFFVLLPDTTKHAAQPGERLPWTKIEKAAR